MVFFSGTGANTPNFDFIGDVLEDIIRDHLQFSDQVLEQARDAIRQASCDGQTYVGVHVR